MYRQEDLHIVMMSFHFIQNNQLIHSDFDAAIKGGEAGLLGGRFGKRR